MTKAPTTTTTQKSSLSQITVKMNENEDGGFEVEASLTFIGSGGGGGGLVEEDEKKIE